jgi:signal transduction histidine kinase
VTRAHLLQAVSYAARRILKGDAFADGVHDVLERFGAAIQVERASLFENRRTNGRCAGAREICTCIGCSDLLLDAPNPGVELPLDGGGLSRWADVLTTGSLLWGQVRDLPVAERGVLEPLGVRSIAAAPVRVNERWWGFIAFSQLSAERSWDPAELEGMKALADMIGSAIQRSLMVDALRQSEQLLRTAFEGMASGLLVTDPEGRIVLANRAALSILQLRGDCRGTSLTDLLPDMARLLEETGAEKRSTVVLDLPDGREHQIGFTSTQPSRSANRITVFRDLTHIMAEEQERRRIQQLARVGEMTAKMGHEIKNPLASILIGLRLLEGELYLDSHHNSVLQSIIEETRNLSRQIHELLGSTKPWHMNVENVRLARVMYDALDAHLELASAQGIEVELAPLEQDAVVAVDPDALKRVLSNLLHNAFEASPTGGRVRVCWRYLESDEIQRRFPGFPGPVVGIGVADQGCGLASEAQQRIFEPFFTTKSSGTGLGLAVCREVVEAHGGVIAVESSPGHGARFEVCLPAGERGYCWQCDCGSGTGQDACNLCSSRSSLCCWALAGGNRWAETGSWPDGCLRCAYFKRYNLQPHCSREAGRA